MKSSHFYFQILIAFMLSGSFLSVNAQGSLPEFSSENMAKFATIYLETQKMENSIDVEIISLLQQYNVSYARYRDILTNKIEGIETSTFSDNEKQFFTAIKQKNDALKMKVELLEKEYCIIQKMDVGVYYAIKNKFLTSPTFQNEVYPYFKDILDPNNED